MNYVLSYTEFVNEGLVVKRKYTDAHPAISVGNIAPVREKILTFIHEKGSVTRKELLEYIKLLNEETGAKTSRKWLERNQKYLNTSESQGSITYKLSSLGKRVYEKNKKLL